MCGISGFVIIRNNNNNNNNTNNNNNNNYNDIYNEVVVCGSFKKEKEKK